MRKPLAATITAVTAVLALSACGAWPGQKSADGDTPAGSGTPAPTQPVTEQNDAPANAAEEDAEQAGQEQAKVLKVQRVPGLTPIVTSASGRTVYRFDNDSANPSKSTCLDACLKLWEPVLAGAGVEIDGGGIDERLIDTIDRPDGEQVTLKGWPLYYFHKDKSLGQTAGYGVGNLWFAIAPDGKKAPRCP